MTAIAERQDQAGTTERRRARRWVGIALGATLAGFALGLGYVAVQGVFGWLSDLGAIAFAVALIPVALHLHKEFRERASAASRAVLGVALFGLALLAISGAGLAVLDMTQTPTTLPVLDFQHLGIFLQGVWMIGLGLLGLRVGPFRRKTSLAALISGVGYAGGAPVSLYMGFETPLFYLAFLVALVGFITWALSLRKDLASPVTADAR
jgi:MFS family permease